MEPGRRTGHDLPLLDGLRAIAALLIVATHVGFETGATAHGAWGAFVARLDIGVALFFALSGFLLVRPWLAAGEGGLPGPSDRRYALRRAARILPAYWLVLLVVLLTTARGTSVEGVVRNLTLTQTYAGPLLPGFTQTWSLCTEVAFYLLLPFVAPLLVAWSGSAAGRRRCAVLLLAACLAAWAWAAVATTSVLPPLAGTWLPGHLDWFAVGLALALAESYSHSRPTGPLARLRAELAPHAGTLLLLAAALYWVAATPLAGPRLLTSTTPSEAVIKEALYACVAGLVLAAVAFIDQERGATAAALGNGSSQHLGRISYGIFLWHLLVLAGVMNVLDRRIFGGGFWPVLLLTVAGTVLVASLSWVALESPVLSWAHRSREQSGVATVPRSRRPAGRP